MPQLDTYMYFSQVFWLLVIYSFFYILVLRNIFIAIFIDGYKAAAERYELKPPELVQWTFKGILGAIISSFQPLRVI